ncbi:tetratricopeptide repeat protein [Azomonas macrocytogenes]|uniref:Tetratricopeptide (TPR) repeat protein n=1 Tax=Azomonas macrocytogenes TaxID=69962 RepID=A0A839SZC9_AZOMA|nr:tetratricopeptide repeat protein [Azomonas macrocytogenes]MBB3102691.1 tetratricopeptide (TPR) repeat protein [Azomonas macrocytogenes]
MKRFFALTALLLIGGCQTTPPAIENIPAPEETAAPRQSKPIQYSSFDQDSLYALLVAELAGQRNRFDIALGNYVQQANATQDPAIAERAFRIAEYLGAEQAALDTALIWAANAPENLDAQRAAAIQLARAGRYDESLKLMEEVLRHQGDTHFDFLALSAARTDPATRAGLLQSFDSLLRKYPDNPQLVFGKAVLLQQDERKEEALALLEQHTKGERPIPSILLQARLLQELGRGEQALPMLKDSLQQHPDDKRLHLAYARQLIENNRLQEAIGEFSALLQQNPSDDDLRFSLALICMEAQAWKEAVVYLEDLIERGSHLNPAYFNLGRAQQALGDNTKALQAYDQVGPGSEYLPAKSLQTRLLLAIDRDAEASAILDKARQSQPDYAVQLYLLEIEALSEQKRDEPAWQLIQKALKQFPEDLNLLYTRAMLAEQRNNLALLESDLRFILKREPDNAMALNALGYTLADRTPRLAEARKLIEQAYQINQDDPAILDSLGWVHYRQGNLKEAESWLRKAFERFPDAEIAAHLGEVLWAQGKQSEARQIWAQAIDQEPDSEILQETLRRLTGSENP